MERMSLMVSNVRSALILSMFLSAILWVAGFPEAAFCASGGNNKSGRFIKTADGAVKDTRTGLEWVVGPDRDMTWDQARAWVQGLQIPGGGWRMPTVAEIKALYEKGKGDCNITPLLKTTGWGVWSGETKGSSSAWYFSCDVGIGGWYGRDYSSGGRAFAVRSRR